MEACTSSTRDGVGLTYRAFDRRNYRLFPPSLLLRLFAVLPRARPKTFPLDSKPQLWPYAHHSNEAITKWLCPPPSRRSLSSCGRRCNAFGQSLKSTGKNEPRSNSVPPTKLS